jgi:hypothetical protein
MVVRGFGALLLIAASASTACATRPPSGGEIAVKADTKTIGGWFAAGGEWMLFSNRDQLSRYNPYVKLEEAKCVSLVNMTGRPRTDFARLNRKRVEVEGSAVEYDALDDGTTAADQLLSKKYSGGHPVENFCLRRYVFLATAIREKQ